MSGPHPVVRDMMRRRSELGLHLGDIHTLTGVARSTVRNWETGYRDPQLAALDAYLRALGLKLAVVPLEPEDVIDDDQLPYGQLVIGKGEAWCAGCKQVRRVGDFDVDRSTKTGRRSRCKVCRCAPRGRRRARQAERRAA